MIAPILPRKPSGFSLLTPEQRRELGAKGGASVAPHKRAFSRNRELASSAGAKGGAAGKKTAGEEVT